MAEEAPELRLRLPRQPFDIVIRIEPNTDEVPRGRLTGESSAVPAKASEEDKIKEEEGGKKKEGVRHKAFKENFGGERCQEPKKRGTVDKVKEKIPAKQPKPRGGAKEEKPGMVDKIKDKPRHQNKDGEPKPPGGAKEEKPRHQKGVDKKK